MKEHGTLFRGDMVRAILAGRKGQTRRLPSRANCMIDGRRPTAAQWARLDWASPQIRVDVGPSPGEYWTPFTG